MKTLKVTIKGTRPLLMNRFGGAEEAPATASRGKKKDYGTPEAQAVKACYQEKGNIFVPSTWVTSALRNAATLFKAPGKRSSLKNMAGCAIVCPEDKLFLGKTIKDIEVDSRGVVVQRARIVRHRPKFENWSLNFSLLVDDELLDVTQVKAIITEAGRTQGIGDFRVNKGGPFGSFEVVSVTEQSA
jgi:hypothetical protein